jgi:hypothetical protein
MKDFLTLLFWLAVYITGCAMARGGDTYDCINAPGDYINYGPPAIIEHNYSYVVATDSARYEPRWQMMLDPNDLRNLEYIYARNQTPALRLLP